MRFALLFVVLLTASARAQESLYMPPASEIPPVEGPILPVRVLADGSAHVDGVVADSARVVATVRQHIRAHPDGAVSYSMASGAPSTRYIHVLDAIKMACRIERDLVAIRDFGAPLAELSDAARAAVRKQLPIRI
ncbi:MAG: biopolymer transporter ExbD, partial [Bacteroidota bacterium]